MRLQDNTTGYPEVCEEKRYDCISIIRSVCVSIGEEMDQYTVNLWENVSYEVPTEYNGVQTVL
jgi:hypothetical protein